LSEWLAVFLFGEAFRQSGVLFHHYAPFIITLPLIGVLFQDIASRGMVKQRVYAIVYALIVNMLASLLL
jgi:O-antigen/teichoic acid export membrane protein